MQTIVYKTVNNLNGKWYIGISGYAGDWRKYNSRGNYYYGSGVHITRALRKYGTENFTRYVIAVCKNREDAYALEAVLVDRDTIKLRDCYNAVEGGNTHSGKNFLEKSIQVSIGGVVYPSITECSRVTGITDDWIIFRCNDPKNTNYQYVDKVSAKRISPTFGRKRYSADDVKRICHLYQHEFFTITQLNRIFSISYPTIRSILAKNGITIRRTFRMTDEMRDNRRKRGNRKIPQETREKMRQSRLKHEYVPAKMVVVSGITYRSLGKAARALGYHHTTIAKRCNDSAFVNWNWV